MDYSVKGILVMLQDLQRQHFGMLSSIFVDTFRNDDGEPWVSCCVFSGGGEPSTVFFYSFDSDEARKVKYTEVLRMVNSVTDGQKC